VAHVVCWNAVIVGVAVFGCLITSKYVNVYFYFLGMGHWTGYVYSVLVAYRAYASLKIGSIGGLVLAFIAYLIIVELKTLKYFHITDI